MLEHEGRGKRGRAESTVSRMVPVHRLRIIGPTLDRIVSAWSISSCEYQERKNSP